MICPHRKKPIGYQVSAKAIARGRVLRRLGYSLRDIEKLLEQEGMRASFATLSRAFKEKKT